MQVPQARFSLAGFWQPVDDAQIAQAKANGLVSFYGVIAANGGRAESVVLSGWNFAGGFGTNSASARPAPIHVEYLAQQADGRLAANPGILGSDLTNGSGSVIVADFNRDGRNDIFLPAHNESPFLALPSTAYLSNAAGTFDRVVLSDKVMAHDAQLVTFGGQPAVVTRTFPPGDMNPIYTFGAGGFQERLDARLSSGTVAGMSFTISAPDAAGRQFAVFGDVGNPPNDPFKIQVFDFANGDIVGGPVDITPYLSTLPQYRSYNSEWGPGVTHTYRVWTDDFNHDGRPDIVAGTSLWSASNPRFPSALDLIQNDGNLRFRDVTAKLNPDLSLETEEIDYAMRMVDLDGSGIDSYLMGREAFPRTADRQGNYLLVNDGTGRLHVALHDEFGALAEQVRAYLAASPEVRAQGLYVPNDPTSAGFPRFIGYRTADGHLNYVADVTLGHWLNNDASTGVYVPVHAFVNVPLDLDIRTAIREAYDVADRNGSGLIRTFAGNDTIADAGAGGPARIDGGLGLDVARYAGARDAYQVGQAADGWHVAASAGAPVAVNDTLVNVERLAFADGVVALDVAGSAGQAYRLYQAALNRVPETAGLSWHVRQLDRGWSLHDDAANFLAAPEFARLYGASPTHEAYVTALYANVLGRTPDPTGQAYWLNHLYGGTMDRASVLVGFSESPENHARVDPSLANGIALDYGVLG